MIDDEAVRKLAAQLDEALLARRELSPLTKSFGPFELDEAYRIQRQGLLARRARGETVIGFKMGLTSEASGSR